MPLNNPVSFQSNEALIQVLGTPEDPVADLGLITGEGALPYSEISLIKGLAVVLNSLISEGETRAAGGRGYFTDYSGTITDPISSKQIIGFNAQRKYLLIQNLFIPNSPSGDIWFNFGDIASMTYPSIQLVPGGTFTMEGSAISIDSLSLIGTVNGQVYTIKELNTFAPPQVTPQPQN